MNLEIETLQLQLPVRGTKHAAQIVELVKAALARLPPLPLAARDVRLPALTAQDLRLKPGASDPEIADAVAASIHRALVQAINDEGGRGQAQTGRASVAADTAPAASAASGPGPETSKNVPRNGQRPPAQPVAGPAGKSTPGGTGRR